MAITFNQCCGLQYKYMHIIYQEDLEKTEDVLHAGRCRVIRRNPPEGRAKNNRSQCSRCQIFLKGNEEGNNNNNHDRVFILLEATQAKKKKNIHVFRLENIRRATLYCYTGNRNKQSSSVLYLFLKSSVHVNSVIITALQQKRCVRSHILENIWERLTNKQFSCIASEGQAWEAT